jgi:hypothetical protein
MAVSERALTVRRYTTKESTMNAKRSISTLAVLGTAALVGATASAALSPNNASLTIRHQLRGCHTWSVNGGAFKARQTVELRRGGWFTVTNNDVMPHKLVKTSGPAVVVRSLKTPVPAGMHATFGPWMMGYMGATVKVTFAHKGTYRFTTKPGEDYMAGMKTVGEDNTLRLTVTVT